MVASREERCFTFLEVSANISFASLVLLGFTCSSVSKESASNVGGLGLIFGSGRSPRKGNTTHSSIFAWRIPQTEEPDRLQSMGFQESDMTERLSTAQFYLGSVPCTEPVT